MKKDHRKALKVLRSLEDEVILPANKGNAMVLMRSDYDKKMRGMLDDTATCKKLKDTTATQETRIIRTLLWLHNNGELTKCICDRDMRKGTLLRKTRFFATFQAATISRSQEPQASHLVCRQFGPSASQIQR